jgi:hypothetical protein
MSILRTTIIILLFVSPIGHTTEPSIEKKEIKNNTLATTKSKNKQIDQEDNWGDALHNSISNSVYRSALWFDSFFTENDAEQLSPKTSAKIRLGWLPKRRDISETEVKFRLKVTLPHFKHKTDLILSDDSDDNLDNSSLAAHQIQSNTENESFTAAIRYVQKHEKNKFTDYRIGISSADVFIRARHKRRFFWKEKHAVKLEPAVYYFLDDGLGARLLVEYDYQIDEKNQYRVSHSIRASESYQGEKWKQSFYHLKQLNNNRASVLGITIDGRYNSEEGDYIEQYKFSYRYRFNALKSWLYFEVEPFVEWPKEEDYMATPGIALRVEGYFQKNH